MIRGAGAEGQNRTDDTRLFRAVLYRLSYLGADVAESRLSLPRAVASGGRKDTDGVAQSQPDHAPAMYRSHRAWVVPQARSGRCVDSSRPIWPAMFSRARIRSPIGGWVSHSDLARSSNDLIGLTM